MQRQRSIYIKHLQNILLSDDKGFKLYLLKWQVGAIITLPLMYLCLDILNWPYWISLFAMQLGGAIVFWPIDRWFFQKMFNVSKNDDTIA